MSAELTEPGRATRLRDRPQQARARARVAAIVKAAEALLAEGAGLLTPHQIAERADVPVSSIYRYFENVQAVYAYLFDALSAEIVTGIETALAASQPGWEDWPEVTGGILQRIHRFFDANRGFARLLVIAPLDAELFTAREAMAARIADLLAARWSAGLDGFSGGAPGAVGAYVVESVLSVEARAVQLDTARAAKLRSELDRALAAYLSLYLNTAQP